ncbi:MAG: TRAP transporter small permease [Dehalococcoidales bacterium]|nr:TRAP transporter small permease [Dehalococcoidales bacterium]
MMLFSRTGVSIENGIHSLSRALRVISLISLFLMMLFVPVDVFGRYVLKTPVYGDLEYQQLAMVFIVFLALPYCTFKKGHIFVELLVTHLSGRVLAIVQSFAYFIGSAIMLLIFFYLAKFGLQELVSSTGRTTVMVSIPLAPFIIIAAFGCLIMALEILTEFLHSLTNAIKRPIS